MGFSHHALNGLLAIPAWNVCAPRALLVNGNAKRAIGFNDRFSRDVAAVVPTNISVIADAVA